MSSSDPSRRSTGRAVLVWAARVVGALVALLVVGIGAAYGVSSSRVARTWQVQAHAIPFSTDSAVVANGQRLARIRGCDDCHAQNLGGKVLVDDPALGRIATANLTAGRAGGALTPEQFELAVRHGLRPDGSPLLVMPSQEYAHLSDEDVGALYSYVRSMPAVRSSLPSTRIGPLGHALHVAGQLHLTPAAMIAQATPHEAPPPVGATVEYGRYQAITCTGCHKMDFAGGPMPGPPGSPITANLTPDSTDGIGRWTEDEFVTMLSTGVRPDGSKVNAENMPIAATSQMTDVEKRAIYRYLRTVEAKKDPR